MHLKRGRGDVQRRSVVQPREVRARVVALAPVLTPRPCFVKRDVITAPLRVTSQHMCVSAEPG